MWQKYILLTIVIVCVYFFVQTQATEYPRPYPISEKRNSRYCGSILADVLSNLCNGVYNMQIYKKSAYDSESDEDYGFGQQQYLEDSRLPFPYRSRSNAAALISGSFRRVSRGITDECCKKSCSMAELRSYCGKP